MATRFGRFTGGNGMTGLARRALAVLLVTAAGCLAGCGGQKDTSADVGSAFSVSLLEQKAFKYFQERANPSTGLIDDRGTNIGPVQPCGYSSIAATGFGLVALCAGAERGWITPNAARAQVVKTLQTLWSLKGDDCPHGFFYHFVNPATGKRAGTCEVSSVDHAWLLAGALFAGQYLKAKGQGTQAETLARQIYERTDFLWLLGKGSDSGCDNPLVLCHGWKPETGFLPGCWGAYSEHMVLYLLAIGSPTHNIPARSWKAWRRDQDNYKRWRTFVDLSLFAHQYSHCFINFKGLRDGLGYDYWTPSVNATIINAQYCRDQADRCATYRNGIWGLSACDGPGGQYQGYRAPPRTAFDPDCTVVPWAACGSLVFDQDIEQTGYATDLCRTTLSKLHQKYGSQIWGRYGFSSAFSVDHDYYSPWAVGIDVGCGLMMIENADHGGFVWQYFMPLDCIKRAMCAVGFNLSGCP